ncbi:MAG TPA: biotin--[acetyl-CoA-carboxylase] ligase [Steroidobacteraceae bacterium]|nr:biotin--[acetyl-CoA-carboxylase] ligase [Steroidobacteraceae bacterium]
MTAPLAHRVIERLADGRFHSGENMAKSLGVSRSAIWKSLRTVRELGLEVHAVTRKGYRLPRPLELLDERAIRAHVAKDSARRVGDLKVHHSIESTNTLLLAASTSAAGKAQVCLAEYQTAGRGRRGKRWVMPFGAGLCLSVGWTFAETPRQLSALGLAIGVAVLRAVRRLKGAAVTLKWPNDIWHEGRKLGGILLELQAEADGPAFVVVGLGLNYRLPAASRKEIAALGLESAEIGELFGDAAPGRNELAGTVIDEIVAALGEFERHGFAPFHKEWREADALSGRTVTAMKGSELQGGIARGIDEEGALLIEYRGRVIKIVSGEVSLRLTHA